MRRALVWLISTAAGLAAVFAALAIFHTTLDKFSLGNATLVFVGIGGLAFIWLDVLLKTAFLRH
jgi:hypothetical protein